MSELIPDNIDPEADQRLKATAEAFELQVQADALLDSRITDIDRSTIPPQYLGSEFARNSLLLQDMENTGKEFGAWRLSRRSQKKLPKDDTDLKQTS